MPKRTKSGRYEIRVPSGGQSKAVQAARRAAKKNASALRTLADK